jgi:hypothetical protein
VLTILYGIAGPHDKKVARAGFEFGMFIGRHLSAISGWSRARCCSIAVLLLDEFPDRQTANSAELLGKVDESRTSWRIRSA